MSILDKLFEFHNDEILRAFIKSDEIINNRGFNDIVCSVSGGSDSDIMMDMVWRADERQIVKYIYIDTGLEYQATKDQIAFLERKYGVRIKRYEPQIPIPLAVYRYGQPFVSKAVSSKIENLQRHGFKWEDRPFEELVEEYPNCRSALLWWCNANDNSRYNIDYNRYLKDFMVMNPPWFNISARCCDYAKKSPAHFLKAELTILGIRKSEGGIRSVAYKNCFSDTKRNGWQYRPLFWFSNKDKRDYEEAFEVTHSRCYTDYGFERTGCVVCPFGKDLEWELRTVEHFEPKLAVACKNIFKDSYIYIYTEQYQTYRLQRKDEYHRKKKAEKEKAKTNLQSFNNML